MKHYKHLTLLIIMGSFFLLLTSCSNTKEPLQKELLIYCGTAMMAPMTEIAEIIEQSENCKILFINGGSGTLLNSIIINQCGDLFLPGSFASMKKAYDRELISEDILVGYNQAVICVQKGNPQNITSDLNNLKSKQYSVAIGNPESSAIGIATKKILQKKGIFEDVLKNSQQLPIDAKDLMQVINSKQVDIIINWMAFSDKDENKPFVDILPIDDQYSKKTSIALGLLKVSRNRALALKLMKFASSKDGMKIFKKHGLYPD